MEHEQAIEDIKTAIKTIARLSSESPEKVSAELEKTFGHELKASKLYRFVPMAFGFVLAKRMGIEKLPSTYYLLNEQGDKVEYRLADQHYFTAALTLAFETMEHGYTSDISREFFEGVLHHSVEFDAINRALNAGDSIEGGELHPTTVYGIKAESISV